MDGLIEVLINAAMVLAGVVTGIVLAMRSIIRYEKRERENASHN